MLDVNESTLRQWADKGLIRTFRTPGGHRRFSREDVSSLIEGRESGIESASPAALREVFLQRIRKRLRGGRSNSPGWLEVMGEEDRVRMRLYGRRLLTVTADYVAQKRHRSEFLEEVRLIGREYGEVMSRIRLSLKDVMEAFIFFRSSLISAISDATEGSPVRSNEVANTWHQIEFVADEFLLAMTEAYERGLAESVPSHIS